MEAPSTGAFVLFTLHMKSLHYICLQLLVVLFAVSCNETPNQEGEDVSANLQISSVEVKGRVAQYDEESSTFTVILPTTTDFSELKLSLVTEGESVTVGGSKFDEGKAYNLSSPLKVTVKVGKKSKDYTIIAKNTGLPVVRITTPQKQDITSKEEWLEGAEMVIDKADGTRDYEGTMSIRGRGNSTWRYDKKPYALKLDKKAEILGMPKDKRWVLLANYIDRTLMRNDLAFWLSRQTNLPYTVSGKFVEVELNGKHMGNYYLCEQVKIGKDRVNITEMEPNEKDPEKITGGYLLEIDGYFDDEKRFRSPIFDQPYQVKSPDDDELSDEAFQYIQDYVAMMEKTLETQKAVRKREYVNYLDVDSSIEFLLLEEVASNSDFYNFFTAAGTHSTYLYKDRDGKLFYGPIWDFDFHTFVPKFSREWIGFTRAMYYPSLMYDEKYEARVKELWKIYREKFLGLTEYIDKVAEEIRLSESINHELWPISTEYNYNFDADMSFDEAIAEIKKGLKTKMDFMDAKLLGY